MQRSDRQFTLPLSRPRERGGLSTDEESLAFGHGRRRIAHEQRVPLYDVSNGRDQYSMQGQGYQFNMSGGQYVRGSAGMQRPSMDYVRGEMVPLRTGRVQAMLSRLVVVAGEYLSLSYWTLCMQL